MNKRITQKEMDALYDLKGAVAKAFKSKGALRILSRLHDNGLIEWDPFAGTAKLTDAGLEAMSS